MRYRMIAATDIGNVREINEDSLQILPELNLAVVADGMGGHKAGEIASRMAVGALSNYFEEQLLISDKNDAYSTRTILREAITMANSEVYSNSRRLSQMEGMGTTLLAAYFQGMQVFVGHIGDSRCYRYSNGDLQQLTDDHTLANELVSENPNTIPPAYTHHVLKKALGIEASCNPDIFSLVAQPKDIFLLCSDGLSGVVDDSDISTILALRSHEPELCIDTLIKACLENGAPDNTSVILVFAVAD